MNKSNDEKLDLLIERTEKLSRRADSPVLSGSLMAVKATIRNLRELEEGNELSMFYVDDIEHNIETIREVLDELEELMEDN